MIDHSGISAANFSKSKSFYDAAFGPLDASVMMTIPTEQTGGVAVVGYGRDHPSFWLSQGNAQRPPVHVAFTADNRKAVDAFHAAALAAGGTDNGKPGLRPQYHPSYYAAFVRDPDGNNIEAVCHKPE